MNIIDKYNQISKLVGDKQYNEALEHVVTLKRKYPGNPFFHVMFSRLVQLGEGEKYTLEDVKEALQSAVELDQSPISLIEYGYFLDSVQDDPIGAEECFTVAMRQVCNMLVETLTGKLKTLQQNNEEAIPSYIESVKELILESFNEAAKTLCIGEKCK